MILRQKIALSFIHRAGGKASRLQLVKWLFLLAQEGRSGQASAYYQFVPYKFGPFSFTLYQELDALIRQGDLGAPTENDLEVTCSRSPLAHIDAPNVEREVEDLWERYGHLSTKALVDTVYSHYPWFTLNCDQQDRRAGERTTAPCAVYTAGYEGLHVDGFLNLLLQTGIQRLVDVRLNPVSRRYGFHKSTLARLCRHLDIEYCHTPEVGIPAAWRKDLQTQGDYDRLFVRYVNEILPEQQGVVDVISRWMKSGPSVLVCQEAEPTRCHRSHLAKEIAGISGLAINHLRRKN